MTSEPTVLRVRFYRKDRPLMFRSFLNVNKWVGFMAGAYGTNSCVGFVEKCYGKRDGDYFDCRIELSERRPPMTLLDLKTERKQRLQVYSRTPFRWNLLLLLWFIRLKLSNLIGKEAHD